jgi:hypothetical protein
MTQTLRLRRNRYHPGAEQRSKKQSQRKTSRTLPSPGCLYQDVQIFRTTKKGRPRKNMVCLNGKVSFG